MDQDRRGRRRSLDRWVDEVASARQGITTASGGRRGGTPSALMFMALAMASTGLGGCGIPEAPRTQADGAAYLLPDEPADPQQVIAARQAAADAAPVVVVGRIGGGANPWIEGRAAFSIVDLSLKPCSANPGDDCPQPWDYCCLLNELPAATALVKIVDPQRQLVPVDARDLLGVKELATVVVQGTAQRDEAGNLTILATGIYVRES